MRTAILLAALGWIALLGYLTVRTLVRHGLEPLTFLSILVLALLAVGIVGALRHPPEE
jgi:hypothetical protein